MLRLQLERESRGNWHCLDAENKNVSCCVLGGFGYPQIRHGGFMKVSMVLAELL